MPDFILDEKKRQELDSNIREMISRGASKDDVMRYSDDFGKMFGKKKDGTTSSPISPSPSPFVSESPEQKKKRHEGVFKSDANTILQNYNAGLDQAFQKRDQFGMIDMFGVNQFSQSREGKAGKIVNDFQQKGTAKKEDIKYLQNVAPKAAAQIVFNGVPQDVQQKIQKTGKVDDKDIETFDANHKAIIEGSIAQRTGNYFREYNAKQISNLQTIPGFNKDMVSNPAYIDQFYQQVNSQKAKEIADLNRQYPIKNIPSGVASVQVRENGAEYDAKLKEINKRYSNSFDAVGRLAASRFATPDKDPLEVGLQYLRYADPDKYALRQKAGRSGADRDIADVGAQILYGSTTDPNKLKNIKASADKLDDRFPDKIIADTRRRLGAELYKKDNWFANLKPSIKELDKAADQLPQENREAYYKFVRPAEQRMLGTDIPQSGVLNQFGSGIMSTVEGTNNFLSGLIGQRTESDIARDALNQPFKTRFEAVGVGPQKARLDELKKKSAEGKKLTPKELEEKNDLEKYTDVRSTTREIIDGSLNLAGQVVFQAVGTKGLAAGLGAGIKGLGFLKSPIATGLATEEAIAASVTDFGLTMPQIANAAGAMVAYASSYDQAEQEGMTLYPNDPMRRKLYAKSVASLNALTERIFKDEKVLDAFRREVRPNVGALVNEIATGKLSREALQPKVKSIVMDGLKIAGLSQIESGKETIEEVATSVGTDLTKMILSPERFDPNQMAENIASTATTMFTDGQLVALFAGIGEFRANKVGINLLSKIGTDDGFTADVKSVINAQVMSGELTSEQGREKMDVVNELEKVNKVDMPKVKAVSELSDNASKKYAVALAHEKLLKKQLLANDDGALKTKIEDQIKSSEEFRKSILDKKVFIDDNFNVNATSESAVQEGRTEGNIIQPQGAGQGQQEVGQVAPGKRLFNDPNPEAAVIENEFKKSKGIDTPEPAPITKLDEERSKKIADAYDQLVDSPDDPEVQAAYQAMADETMEQFDAIAKSGVKVEIWTGKGEPYKNSAEMIADVRDNKHMYIFSTEEGFGDTPITDQQRQQNALLRDSGIKDVNGKPLLVNDVFRFVHDYFGHTRLGNSFGAIGEENAWNVHARMYSPLARRAMTTETRGQNSWVNFNKSFRNADGTMKKKGDEGYVPPAQRPFAEQKMALLPEEFSIIEDSYSLQRVDQAKVADSVNEIKQSTGETGVTMNLDGSVYTGGGLVVPAASMNTTVEELTPEMVDQFVEQNRGKIEGNQFKIGLYRFPGSNRVSIDLNIITPAENREAAVKFAGMAGQESIYDLDTNENIKTGATGDNPTQFSDSQFKEIANALANNKMPDVFGKGTDKITKTLADALNKATTALRAANIKFRIVDSTTDTKEAKAARGNQGLFVSEDGTIIIDRSKLADEIEAGLVVWHEASHPVMNIIRNTNKPLYDAVVRGLNKAAKTNDGVAKALDWAQSQPEYNNVDTQNDEAVVETIGRINSGLIDINDLDTGLRQKLIDFVNSIAKFFGIPPVLNDTDLAAFKKTVSQVADALKTGRDIGEVVGQENVKEYMNNLSSPEIVAAGQIAPQQRVGDGKISVYESKEVSKLPVRSMQDIYDQFGGRAVAINSDPTRVGELTLPSGKKIFMYGGPAYPAVKDNVDSNVGFATTQLSKVAGWVKYTAEVFGTENGVTIVATQAPTSILSNSYALRYVMDAISMLPKGILRSSEFKAEFFGKDLVLLKDAFGEKGYNDFVNKYKKADLSKPDVIDDMIAEMAYKVGDDNNPASFKARGAFVSNLLGGITPKSSVKGVEGDNGYVSKKPNKFIAKQLMDRLGINAEKVMREIGEPSLVDLYMNEGKWGMAVSGFESVEGLPQNIVDASNELAKDPENKSKWKVLDDAAKDYASRFQEGGVKHPLFNAKFPGKNAFILDGAYEVNKIFKPIEMTGPKGGAYTKTAAQMLAGSMYVKGKPTQGEGTFEYSTTQPSGDRIQASVGNRNLAPNGKPSNLTPAQYQQVRTPQFKKWFGDWENDPANASKVVDENGEPRVVYHGTNENFDEFKKEKLGSKNWMADSAYMGFFFAGDKKTSEAYTGMNRLDMVGISFGQYDDIVNKYKPEIDKANEDIRKVSDRVLRDAEELKLKEKSKVIEMARKSLEDSGLSKDSVSKLMDDLIRSLKSTFTISQETQDIIDKENEKTGNTQRLIDVNKKLYKEIEERWKAKTGATPRVMELFVNIKNPRVVNYQGSDATNLPDDIESAISQSKDGVVFNNLADGAEVDDIFVAFEPNQIKSATDNSGEFSTTDNRIQASVGNRSEDDLRAPGAGKERNRALSSKFGDLDPETQAKIEDDATTYFQRTNKQTAKAVEEFIDGRNLVDMADYVLSNPDIPEVSRVWMAAEVAKRLNTEIAAATDKDLKSALTDKQAAIYNEYAKKATDLGQAVQAFIAFKQDPSAVEFFLPKILRELKKKGAENVTEAQKADIVNMLKDINSAADGIPKDKAIIKLSHYLGRLAPVKPMDVLQALWYAKILSGVTTQSTNFFANIFNTAFELPAVALRVAMLNKAPLSLAAGAKGFGAGIVKGAVAAADIMRTGVRSKEADKYFAENPLEYFTWSQWLGPKGKALDKIPPLNFGAWKYVGRMLAATDALFSTANQEAIANMLAYAEAAGTPGGNNFKKAQAILGNTKQDVANAKAQATAEGFDPKSLQGRRRVIEIVAQGRKGNEEADMIGKRITMNYDPEGWTKPIFDAVVALQRSVPVIKMVIPFARIVANLTENGLNYTPLGLIRATTGRRNPFNDKANRLSIEERIDLFNKFALGTTALVALIGKVGKDDDDWFEITAAGSNDPQKKYELQEGGWRPYTITFKDGTKVSYKDWPIAGILAGLGHIRDAKNYSFDDSTQMGLFATGFFLNFYDKSLLSGLQDFFGIFNVEAGRGKYAPETKASERAMKYAAQQVRSLAVSNLTQQTGRMYSELVTGEPQRDAKTFMELIYRDLPMFNDGIRPIIDVFGDEVKYNTTERLTPITSPEGEEMIKWLNENKFFVGTPKKRNIINADGTEREMNDAEYYEFRKLAGQKSKEWIGNLMNGIKNDNRQVSEAFFDGGVQAARDLAYVEILSKYGFK